MKYFKKLLGDRIYLSPRSIEDVEKFTEWMNDFEVTDYTGRSGQIMSLEGERKYLQEDSNPEATFSIITLDEDKLIGTVGLERIDHMNRTATLGSFIGDKEYLSKGYGTEAIRLLLDYGFNYMNLHSIKLHLMSFNERALKCYKKCGFKETGRIRENRFINGKYYDTIAMDILENEFRESYIRNKNVK
ncbi:MAG: GNAT family N-acetyltransferase [Clostridia bacterium]|nr:GNAT family N-acetyltransferase [Clostridia bacterium]